MVSLYSKIGPRKSRSVYESDGDRSPLRRQPGVISIETVQIASKQSDPLFSALSPERSPRSAMRGAIRC